MSSTNNSSDSMPNPVKVFIDGQAGTTGLDMRERLLRSPHYSLLEIDPDERKRSAEHAGRVQSAAARRLLLCGKCGYTIERIGRLPALQLMPIRKV